MDGGAVRQHANPRPDDVHREARRRLATIGYETARTRELATGVEMPKAMRYLRMQIDFVAQSLASLATIPDDFHSDKYWPAWPGLGITRADR